MSFKNKSFPVLSSLLFTALFLLGMVQFHPKTKVHTKQSSAAMTNGGVDDPNGRMEFDFMRFRNPATNAIPAHIRAKELAFAATLPQYGDYARSSTGWQQRGPANVGGRTRALALDVTNENIILAGQVTGGMWRSTDGGAHFSQTTKPQDMHSVSCIAQDKRAGKTNTWYYGTGEEYAVVNAAGFSSGYSGDGIFKSTDGGLNWNKLSSTSSNTPTTLLAKRDFDFVWRIVVDPTNTAQDVVYAAVVNGIWRSTDGGNSWTSVLGLDTTQSGISTYTDIAITSTGVLYAAISSETASKGIYRSTDGINWVRITPLLPGGYERINICIAPSDESQVYFLIRTPSFGTNGHNLWHYQYVSGDGSGAGGVWNNRTTFIPHDHCIPYFGIDFKHYDSQDGYDMYVRVKPDDANTVFLGGTDIFRSTDGFTSNNYSIIGGYRCDTLHQSDYVYRNHHPDQHELVFLPSNSSVAFSSNDGGIFKTMDILAPAVTYASLDNGYATGQFYTCAIQPGNTNNQIIIGGLQDNGTQFTNTIDPRSPWTHVHYGDGSYCALTHDRSWYYVSVQEGKVFKSRIEDNATVDSFTRIDPIGGTGYVFISPMILDPLNDSIMYLAGGRAVWSNDDLVSIPVTGNEAHAISTNWSLMSNTITGNGSPAINISCLNISEANTNVLYYGTDNGHIFKVDSCRKNTGAVTDISSSSFPVGAYVSSINADRLNEHNILLTFSNYGVISIFYSSNGGTTWTNVSGNLEEHPDGSGNGPSVTWGHIYHDATTLRYYVGTSIGLYSTDVLNGLNTVWTQEGPNTIGNVVINMITSRVFDQNIVVATHGAGVFSNKIFTGIKDIAPTNSIALYAFPNPMTSNVSFDIATNGNPYTLEIFDLMGKLVYSYSNNKQTNQRENFLWNGNSQSGETQAAGTYLCRLHTREESRVIKVLKL